MPAFLCLFLPPWETPRQPPEQPPFCAGVLAPNSMTETPMLRWLISLGDALSQAVGRLIWFRRRGEWVCWTLSPNESISGASYRWAEFGSYRWAMRLIDLLLSPFESNHCRKSFEADAKRAAEYIVIVEKIRQMERYRHERQSNPDNQSHHQGTARQG